MLQIKQEQKVEVLPVLIAIWIVGTGIFIMISILGALADLGY